MEWNSDGKAKLQNNPISKALRWDCCSGPDVGSTHRISASIQMSSKCLGRFLAAVVAAAFSALRRAVLHMSTTEAHHQTRVIAPFELSSVLTILKL